MKRIKFSLTSNHHIWRKKQSAQLEQCSRSSRDDDDATVRADATVSTVHLNSIIPVGIVITHNISLLSATQNSTDIN